MEIKVCSETNNTTAKESYGNYFDGYNTKNLCEEYPIHHESINGYKNRLR